MGPLRSLLFSASLAFAFGCTADTFVSGDSGADGSADDAADAASEAAPCNPSVMACNAWQLCTNFDNGSYAPFTTGTVNGGTASVDTGVFVSCPNAVKVTVGPGSSPVIGSISASAPVSSPTSGPMRSKLDADVWLPTNPSGLGTAFLTLGANQDTNATVELAYSDVDSQWRLHATAGSGAETKLSPPPRTGAWNHMTLAVTFTAATVGGDTATLDYIGAGGGSASVAISAVTLPTATGNVTSIGAGLGIMSLINAPSTTMTAYFDDVTFTPNAN